MVIKQVLKYSIALLILIYVSTIPITITGDIQPIYRPGDYFIYRLVVEEIEGGFSCRAEAKIKINIARIDHPVVVYNATFFGVNGTGKCTSYIPPLNYSTIEEHEVNVYPNSTMGILYLVHSSYSGEYTNTVVSEQYNVTISSKYKNGVLTRGYMALSYWHGAVMLIEVELIDTSVKELLGVETSINESTGRGELDIPSIIIITLLVFVAGIVVYNLIHVKHLKKQPVLQSLETIHTATSSLGIS
jgi:hypothetical protein